MRFALYFYTIRSYFYFMGRSHDCPVTKDEKQPVTALEAAADWQGTSIERSFWQRK